MTLVFWLLIALAWIAITIAIIAVVSRINETFDAPDHLGGRHFDPIERRPHANP